MDVCDTLFLSLSLFVDDSPIYLESASPSSLIKEMKENNAMNKEVE